MKKKRADSTGEVMHIIRPLIIGSVFRLPHLENKISE